MHLMNKMGRIYLYWTRLLKQQLVPHDITLKQQFLLKQLVKKPFLYPHQIADMLYCDRPTASVIIGNMVKKGWVEKVQDDENKKQFKVVITSKGKEKWQTLDGASGCADMDRFDPLKCLTDFERLQLDELISKVLKNL